MVGHAICVTAAEDQVYGWDAKPPVDCSCDAVGRWPRPRVCAITVGKAASLFQVAECTEVQRVGGPEHSVTWARLLGLGVALTT